MAEERNLPVAMCIQKRALGNGPPLYAHFHLTTRNPSFGALLFRVIQNYDVAGISGNFSDHTKCGGLCQSQRYYVA